MRLSYDKVADKWGLSSAERRALMPYSSDIERIYELLHSIFTDDANADSWVYRVNKALVVDGVAMTALAYMMVAPSPHVDTVKRYLAHYAYN